MIRGSVVDRVTILDVLRAAQRPLPNKGGYFLCPVHDDHSPSCHIVPNSDERAWRCFGCGKAGGILRLVIALGKASTNSDAAVWLENLR